jgi:hypothetical protein
MRDVTYLLFHLLTTVAKLLRTGGGKTIIGFGVYAGNVDAPALCRMFNQAA